MFPELREVTSSTDEFFSYADIEDVESCLKALELLDSYVIAEGPFDGVLAFSQGAIIAASYLARRRQLGQLSKKSDLPFKCAIFFSAPAVYRIENGQLRPMTRDADGEMINIPTAHIWGSNDTTINGQAISDLCASETREIYVHEGGHEVPGARMNSAVKSSVQIIRRVISMTSYKQ